MPSTIEKTAKNDKPCLFCRWADIIDKLERKEMDKEYAKALVTYLALAFDRLLSYNSSLCLWDEGEFVKQTFMQGQSLPMRWDYFETNPFSGSTGSFSSAVDWICRVIKHCSLVSETPATISQGNAINLQYSQDYFDAVITDPPYYDNVPYADLSDFFYVWLKRVLKHLYPGLFSTPLTPKSMEIIQEPMRHDKNQEKAKKFFESKLTESFQNIYRVLKRNGIACIMFAHKSAAAWETLIDAMLKSGLVTTASWPVHTERTARLRYHKSAALASSIFFVCRKAKKKEEAYFEEIEGDIKKRIRKRLDYFWQIGIRGADFFVASIGPATEVFGRYEEVKRYSGEPIFVSELLELVEKYVAEYALNRILKSPPGFLAPETRFYLVWRWTYHNNRIPFDDARMLGQALGFEISDHMGRDKLIKKIGSDVKVRNPKERSKKFLAKRIKKLGSMVDVMHKAAVFWKEGQKEKLNKVLEDSGYLENERFWMFAQAVSEVLPNGDPEKKMLQGLLAGRRRIERGPKATKVTDFM